MLLWYLSCILSCIDTRLFVYSSMSTLLCGNWVRMLMCAIFLIVCLMSRQIFKVTRIMIYISLWIIYMIFHGLVFTFSEYYVLFNDISMLVFAVLLHAIIKSGIITYKDIDKGVMLILFIHISYLLLQYLGILDSGSSYFKLTGCGDNPNVTAILLVTCTPFLTRMIYRRYHIYINSILLILSIIFLFVLRCRTAYIGMFLIVFTAFVVKYHERIKAMRKPVVIIGVVVTCLLVGLLSNHLYKMKQSSADGRIFIWKQTVGMIADNPVGVGYGMFERSYNNYVSEYFATHETERKHSILTSRVVSAYNDYLEQGAEGGIVGMLFLVGFYLLLVWETVRRRDIFSLSIVVAYMVMSAVNFIILTNIPWLLLLCVTSMIKSSDKEKLYFLSNQKLTILPLLLISLLVLFFDTRFIIAQSMLKQYKCLYKRTNFVTKGRLDSLRNIIGTSEAYYTFCSEYSAASGNYQKAIEYGLEALKYTSSPNLMLSVSEYYEKNKDLSNAVSMMKRLSDMLPGNFSTKYLMLLLYEKAGNHSAARTMAVEITEKPVKIESEETSYIKAYAMRYLNQSLCE